MQEGYFPGAFVEIKISEKKAAEEPDYVPYGSEKKAAEEEKRRLAQLEHERAVDEARRKELERMLAEQEEQIKRLQLEQAQERERLEKEIQKKESAVKSRAAPPPLPPHLLAKKMAKESGAHSATVQFRQKSVSSAPAPTSIASAHNDDDDVVVPPRPPPRPKTGRIPGSTVGKMKDDQDKMNSLLLRHEALKLQQEQLKKKKRDSMMDFMRVRDSSIAPPPPPLSQRRKTAVSDCPPPPPRAPPNAPKAATSEVNKVSTIQEENEQTEEEEPVKNAEDDVTPPKTPQQAWDEYKADVGRFTLVRFAAAYFVKPKKGLMGKTPPVGDLIKWVGKPAKGVLLCTTSESSRARIIEMFGMVDKYMNRGGGYQELANICEKATGANNPNQIGVLTELLFYLIKQTNGNPDESSRERGYEIIAQSLRGEVVPSEDVLNVVRNYIIASRTEDSAVGGLCNVIFHSLLLTGDERKSLSVLSVDDLSFAKRECRVPKSCMNCSLEQVFRFESFSSNPLSKENPLTLLSLNSWTPTFLTLLIDICKSLGGTKQEGIFRTGGDKDNVLCLKREIEENGYRMLRERIKGLKLEELSVDRKERMKNLQAMSSSVKDMYAGPQIRDCIEAADLTKIWLRSMSEPLIPFAFYSDCLEAGKSGDCRKSVLVFRNLLAAQRHTIDTLLNFLVTVADNKETMMDDVNLATVFCPNLLRNVDDDPMKFATNAENEKRFITFLLDAKRRDMLEEK